MDNSRRQNQRFSITQLLTIPLINLMVGVLATPVVNADTLVTNEYQISSSLAYETTPALGNKRGV